MSEYMIARTSWLADMECLSDSERGRLFTALLTYAASGEKQEPRGTERVLFYKMANEIDVNAIEMSNIYINKHNNFTSQESKENVNNRFSKFWDSYPVKVSKKKAEAIFNKLNPDDKTIDLMLHSIDVWKQSRQWQEGYIPHPDTWLRGERWNDEPPKTPQAQVKRNARAGYANRTVTMEDLKDIIVDLTADDVGIGGLE